jgi:hypothetical protein
MPEDEDDDQNDQQQVFQDPCLLVERMNRCNEPGRRASRGQATNKFSLEIHPPEVFSDALVLKIAPSQLEREVR